MAYDKVVDSASLDADLKAIADAIREKTGSTGKITLDQMAAAILSIAASVDENGVAVFTADFSGASPSAAQFYSWEGRTLWGRTYDALQNIRCENGVATLASVYDSAKALWVEQMMTTAGLFESDDFTCTFRGKFSGLPGSWQYVITYGTGTYWTDGMYSDGIQWPEGGEIDAFEQVGGYAQTPNYMITPTVHYGSRPNYTSDRGTNTPFTTDEWHDFKFTLRNGVVETFIDGVSCGSKKLNPHKVDSDVVCGYNPFLRPQAFYIGGQNATDDAVDKSSEFRFEISDFKVIQDADVACTGLEIYPQMWAKGTELVFPVGSKLFLEKEFTPKNTSNKACTWTSSNESVATVVQGHVNVLGVGKTTITARCGNATATYEVVASATANIPCVKIVCAQSIINLTEGDTYDLSEYVTAYPSFTTEPVLYQAIGSGVTVSSDGIVTAQTTDGGRIIITCGDTSMSVSVSVAAKAAPLIDTTFDLVNGTPGQTDTLVGGLTNGETYTAIWVVCKNPEDGRTFVCTSALHNNKAPGIQIKNTGEMLGREFMVYDRALGTLSEQAEIRIVFTVGGKTNIYVDGVLKYEGTSAVASAYYPVGTDTYVSQVRGDAAFLLSRFALYAGEYLEPLS